MGKNKAGPSAGSTSHSNADTVAFPVVGGLKKPRKLCEPQILAVDQIVAYANALTDAECDSLIDLFRANADGQAPGLQLQPSPAAKKGEAQRTNMRFSTTSPTFARQLYEATGIREAVKDWPSMFPRLTVKPVGLSSNIRIYKYEPGAIFACHYDDHSVDPHYGAGWGKTEWTLLIYLSGEPEVQGGQTVFYTSHVRPKNGAQSDKAIIAPLKKGTALLHRHGKACMLHEALPPTKGTKWVLRSDVVFGERDV